MQISAKGSGLQYIKILRSYAYGSDGFETSFFNKLFVSKFIYLSILNYLGKYFYEFMFRYFLLNRRDLYITVLTVLVHWVWVNYKIDY